MKAINKLLILNLIETAMSSCAWYKSPEMMPDANAIDTFESGDDYDGEYDAYDGNNLDTTIFNNI